jgi:hypothetical protein
MGGCQWRSLITGMIGVGPHDSSSKRRGQKGNWLPPFVHFAPMESDLVAKAGIREPWFTCVGSAALAAPRRCHESHLPGAGFEPGPGSPGSSVVDRTTALQ